MNVIEIPESGKRVEYPSCWEELNRKQLLFIVRLGLRLMAGEVSVLEFKVRVFYFLTGIKRKQRHNREERYLTREEMERKYGNIVLAAETVDVYKRQWNHSKVQLIKSDGNYFVVEGSGNFSENAANEQYIFVNNEEVYRFRKGCFDASR